MSEHKISGTFPLIDPHVHVSARTTDDYQAMRQMGIVAVVEPAFWNGQPRTNSGSFLDYFSSLVGWERYRASQFGIQHYCAIGLNSKESNNEALAEEVMELLPRFVAKERVVAVGEIGFDEMSALEEKYFRAQLEIAKELTLPVIVHTPHRNKKAGVARSMDICEEHGLSPEWVIMDHNNEETVSGVLERGYWTAFTLYPKTKMGSKRMVDIVKKYGCERIIINSSADWGNSDPLAVPKTARLMLDSGISVETVRLVCYKNALDSYERSGQFNEKDWLEAPEIDSTLLYQGNSILRGSPEQ